MSEIWQFGGLSTRIQGLCVQRVSINTCRNTAYRYGNEAGGAFSIIRDWTKGTMNINGINYSALN